MGKGKVATALAWHKSRCSLLFWQISSTRARLLVTLDLGLSFGFLNGMDDGDSIAYLRSDIPAHGEQIYSTIYVVEY